MDFERRRRELLIERVENIGRQAKNPEKMEIVTGFSCKLPPPRPNFLIFFNIFNFFFIFFNIF